MEITAENFTVKTKLYRIDMLAPSNIAREVAIHSIINLSKGVSVGAVGIQESVFFEDNACSGWELEPNEEKRFLITSDRRLYLERNLECQNKRVAEAKERLRDAQTQYDLLSSEYQQNYH